MVKNNTDWLFEKLKITNQLKSGSTNEIIDVFEALSSLAVFSSGSLDEKADFIMCLFDFDGTGTINSNELKLTF